MECHSVKDNWKSFCELTIVVIQQHQSDLPEMNYPDHMS